MKIIFAFILLFLSTSFSFAFPAKVVRILDGDTFEIETGDKVRMVGINAPEMHEPFGKYSKDHLSNLILLKLVDLQLDVISNDRDIFNRLLCYVTLNGTDINKIMILDGYAYAYTKYRFDKMGEYCEAESLAKKNNSGVWSSNDNKDSSKRNQNNPHFFSKTSYFVLGIMGVILAAIGLYYYFYEN